MIKKTTALFLIIAFLIPSFSVVCKEENEFIKNNYIEAEKAVIRGWNNYQSTIDLSLYKIPEENINYFCNKLIDRNSEYFYVSDINYSVDRKNQFISSITYEYHYSIDEIEKRKKFLKKQANKF